MSRWENAPDLRTLIRLTRAMVDLWCKSQLASDRNSCRSPLANQMRLLLHTAAYWLMLTVRDAIPRPQPLTSGEFSTTACDCLRGSEAVLTRKHSPASARQRIFDGAAEAKLIALLGSKPPKGRVRWTFQLLESEVVELNIVDRASDNTIARVLKKTNSSLISKSNGLSRPPPSHRLRRGRLRTTGCWLRWLSGSTTRRSCIF